MQTELTIDITGATLRNGRLYFGASDRDFFPTDALGDRSADGHQGRPVRLCAGADTHATDIRVCSGRRLSPRRSFANYLKSIGAGEGTRLRVTRTSEREYQIEPLA